MSTSLFPEEAGNPELEAALGGLDDAERAATRLARRIISAYSTYDGVGLFTGKARYETLTQRIREAAITSRTLRRFLSTLCRRMLFPPPSRGGSPLDWAADIAPGDPDREIDILRCLAEDTVAVVVIARAWARALKSSTPSPKETSQ